MLNQLSPRELWVNNSMVYGDPLPDPTLCRSMIAALQYVTLTGPDLSFVVNKARQFMAQLTGVQSRESFAI